MATFDVHHLERNLNLWPRPPAWRVAYSGGLDSHVLLHALSRLEAAVEAVHVHHGLAAEADAWAHHCRDVAKALGVPCRILRVDARAGRGESPEGAARQARYDALRTVVAPQDALVTAHHADDQLETVLLQLMRGAGPDGLAGMPERAPFGAGWILRPLLDVDRAALADYARRHNLAWVEDPSNRDPAVDRAYLRRAVVPVLRHRWPAAAAAAARSARHVAAAAAAARDQGQQDLRQLRDPAAPEALPVSGLLGLSPERRRNVLRAWLRDRGLPPPSTAQLETLIRAVGAAPDRVPRVRWPGAEVRRYRDRIYADTGLPDHDPTARLPWDLAGTLALPDGGTLAAVPTAGGGLSMAAVRTAPVAVRFRAGGERCHLAGHAHSRPLKHLMQEHGIPPWLRDRVPLVYCGDRLAAVAGIGVCASFAAAPGAAGVRLEWRPPASASLWTRGQSDNVNRV